MEQQSGYLDAYKEGRTTTYGTCPCLTQDWLGILTASNCVRSIDDIKSI